MVLVHRSLYERGPLINAKQAEALRRQVEEGIAAGARPLLRGEVSGTRFEPVVLADVTTDMPIAQAELFGPVARLMPFDDEDEAAAIANDTPFGLSGAVHTRDLERGVEFAKRIEIGMVHVNDATIHDATIHDEPIVAFGGEKRSGLGRLNGEWSLAEFTTLKWISVHRGRRVSPY
ncbi:aldehyde dehydrogenase family protein [Amycolatopsis carbonis]|uniref:Aldehyde dehydrogenase family protein n=1 Tax=Amycolatopsis carbonis TaxID=715471 RepID=A0A9Y2INZ7_9PSEU|nr:aldehyde dehydrogenase family protein [Amycolatopsis sp. 2-15]WIX82741.1 aldehyde dehydrogenase family protein [Amycolatopsis sp. 2-15]